MKDGLARLQAKGADIDWRFFASAVNSIAAISSASHAAR
jgi:hypothetical protein